MDRFFAVGSKILNFFEKAFSLETYRPYLEDPYWAGGTLLTMVLMAFAVLRKRQARLQRQKKQKDLELALLDEDPENRELDLPEPALPEDGDDGVDFAHTDAPPDAEEPDPWQGDFQPDPSFSNQIIITAQSSRKTGPEAIAEPESKPETEAYTLEIEEEFAKLEEELKEKEQEVLQKHQFADVPDPAPSQSAEEIPDADPPGLIVLKMEELIEEEEPEPDESGIFSEGDLEDLWSNSEKIPPREEEPSNVSELERMEREMEEVIDDLTQKLEHPDAEDFPLTDSFSGNTTPSPQRKFDRLIQRLEEFQKDMEHRLQSNALETLTQRNLELVKSFKKPPAPEEDPEQAVRAQAEARTALEKLAYPKKSSWS